MHPRVNREKNIVYPLLYTSPCKNYFNVISEDTQSFCDRTVIATYDFVALDSLLVNNVL